jgi:PAS domain S-box-containing protein
MKHQKKKANTLILILILSSWSPAHAAESNVRLTHLFQIGPDVSSDWVTLSITIGAGLISLFILYTILRRRFDRIQTKALEESEERYRRFFMTSKDPVFITSKEGKWLDVNDATVRLFGYDSKEEFLDTTVQKVYANPEERPLLLAQVEEEGFVKDMPLDLIDIRGNILHTLLTTTVIKSNDRKIVGYQGTIRDNTSWIETQQSLEENRESLDLAISGTGAGLWDWNIKSNQITINERWAEMIGYQQSELVPVTIDTWEGLSHPEDLEKSNKLILQHFAGDLSLYQCEFRMKHKNGNWIWVLSRGRVVSRANDGSPLRMVGTTQDVTERVKIRDEIQDYADQLEALYEVTSSLSSTLSLKDLLRLILVKLEETLSFDSASIFLLENEELRIETVHNHPNPDLVVGKTFPTTNLLFQEIRKKKKPIIIDNAMRDSRFQGWGGMHHVKGWLGVPLIIQDDFIGYITLDSHRISAFGSEEAKLANIFATQAAQAINNARLYEKLSHHADSLESQIQDRTMELQKMVDHMTGREIRMAELKDVITQLKAQLEDHNIEPAADDPLK